MNSAAVLLAGEEEDKLIVALNSFPVGIKEGQWLQIDIAQDRLLRATVDHTELPK
jgi:hypothetical protein